MAETPPYLLFPVRLPIDVAARLLDGVNPQPIDFNGCSGYPAFSQRAFSFAHMELPEGIILRWDWSTGEIVMILSDSSTSSTTIKPLLHRLRSGKTPARNELLVIGKAFGAGGIVHVDMLRIERFKPNDSQREITVALVGFKVVEWLPAIDAHADAPPPAQQTPEPHAHATNREGKKGKEGRWVEVDPIVALCERQRLENTRVANRLKNAAKEWDESRAWRGAISSVLDHCNGRRLPRDFAVAWQFVHAFQIVQKYVSDRKFFGPEGAKAQAVASLAELGGVRQDIAKAAIDGYERAATRQLPGQPTDR